MPKRKAYSLLELVITTAIMATVVTSTVALMGSSRLVWETSNADAGNLVEAHAMLRHLVRHLRQAKSVTSISAASDQNGSLEVIGSNDQSLIWNLTGDEVLYGESSATDAVAGGIAELYFVGYQSDGTTLAASPAEIRSVLCRVVVALDRQAEPTRTIECFAWMRAWN